MSVVQTFNTVVVYGFSETVWKPRALLRLGIVCLGVVSISILGGCASPGSPVISDRSLGDRSQQTYVVVRGDTLYSIAWRFNLDHRGLAAANDIGSPFTIYPGQKLRLAESQRQASRQSQQGAKAPEQNNAGQSRRRPVSKAASTAQATPASKPAVKPSTVAQRTSQPNAKAPTPPAQGSKIWHRPLPQPPSILFGSNNRGLDYAITARSRVRSTRSGEVVYAGNGIAGFERLVIIKHTTDLLSAYSFNGKIRVAEEQRISGGAIIAEILPRPGVGQTLHFEVRRKGQPINPAMLLPKS